MTEPHTSPATFYMLDSDFPASDVDSDKDVILEHYVALRRCRLRAIHAPVVANYAISAERLRPAIYRAAAVDRGTQTCPEDSDDEMGEPPGDAPGADVHSRHDSPPLLERRPSHLHGILTARRAHTPLTWPWLGLPTGPSARPSFPCSRGVLSFAAGPHPANSATPTPHRSANNPEYWIERPRLHGLAAASQRDQPVAGQSESQNRTQAARETGKDVPSEISQHRVHQFIEDPSARPQPAVASESTAPEDQPEPPTPRRHEHAIRERVEKVHWYASEGAEPTFPAAPAAASLGDLYVHKDDAREVRAWLRVEPPAWEPVREGHPHPIIHGYVLRLLDNGEPRWVKKTTYGTYVGRKKRQARLLLNLNPVED